MTHPRLADVVDRAAFSGGDRSTWSGTPPDAQTQRGRLMGLCITFLDR